MKLAVFSTRSYDERFLRAANERYGHELVFFEPRLALETAPLAQGFPAVCPFVNDQLDRPVLERLAEGGTKLLALRSAGFNHVDCQAAHDLGFAVMRVPAYSPHAVAEHAVGLILALNRKVHRAYARVRDGNLSLEGLLGFDLHGRTVGIVGTGKIGAALAHIMHGFGCRLLAHDVFQNPEVLELGAVYVTLDQLLAESDIISLHVPLLPSTYRMIDAEALKKVKTGAMLVNTSRGALIDTLAVIDALKEGKIGYLGLDVYEEETGLFYEDLSGRLIEDDVFARLLTLPNVVITGHQGFFTEEALSNIADTTLTNLTDFEQNRPSPNRVRVEDCEKQFEPQRG